MITFKCTSCGAAFRVPDERTGKQGTCARCGKKIIVPRAYSEGTRHNGEANAQGRDKQITRGVATVEEYDESLESQPRVCNVGSAQGPLVVCEVVEETSPRHSTKSIAPTGVFAGLPPIALDINQVHFGRRTPTKLFVDGEKMRLEDGKLSQSIVVGRDEANNIATLDAFGGTLFVKTQSGQLRFSLTPDAKFVLERWLVPDVEQARQDTRKVAKTLATWLFVFGGLALLIAMGSVAVVMRDGNVAAGFLSVFTLSIGGLYIGVGTVLRRHAPRKLVFAVGVILCVVGTLNLVSGLIGAISVHSELNRLRNEARAQNLVLIVDQNGKNTVVGEIGKAFLLCLCQWVLGVRAMCSANRLAISELRDTKEDPFLEVYGSAPS